jgi:hypothetical protein
MVVKSYVPTHVKLQNIFILMVHFVMSHLNKLKRVIQIVRLGVQTMNSMARDVVILLLSYVQTHVKIKILDIIPKKVSFAITLKH